MRTTLLALLLPFTAWLSALQALAARTVGIDDTARFVGFAGVLGTLTVLIYRLGVWRQEMENTKHNIGADVTACHEELSGSFDRLELRLEAIDHMIGLSEEQRARAARWQVRTNRRLERLEDSTEE